MIYQTATVVMGTTEFFTWSYCVGLRRDYATVWEAVLKCSLPLRVVIDVLIGLGTEVAQVFPFAVPTGAWNET